MKWIIGPMQGKWNWPNLVSKNRTQKVTWKTRRANLETPGFRRNLGFLLKTWPTNSSVWRFDCCGRVGSSFSYSACFVTGIAAIAHCWFSSSGLRARRKKYAKLRARVQKNISPPLLLMGRSKSISFAAQGSRRPALYSQGPEISSHCMHGFFALYSAGLSLILEIGSRFTRRPRLPVQYNEKWKWNENQMKIEWIWIEIGIKTKIKWTWNEN